LDLAGQIIDLDVTASAPAMTRRQDMSWKRVSLQAHARTVHESGRDGTSSYRWIEPGAAQLRTFSADLEGNRGRVGMHAVLDRLRIPEPKPVYTSPRRSIFARM
jgi:hypothetical protein